MTKAVNTKTKRKVKNSRNGKNNGRINAFAEGEKRNPKINGKKAIIELQHVNKSFLVGKNPIPVLKDINIKIYPEEFIILLGPSGSGKSTLLNTLIGLEYPTSGRVIINGENIFTRNPNQIAKFRYKTFGIVFQRTDWVRSLNVIQNVALPLAINNISKKEREEKAMYRLREMRIDDHAGYTPTELSGGQQQKVSLARALVSNPPILIADEPTGNLDTDSAEKVMQFLKNLNERLKKTLLLVTHNIDYVTYASRTIYIRDGKILEGSGSFKE